MSVGNDLIATAFETAAADLDQIAVLTALEYDTQDEPLREFARDAATGGIRVSASYLRQLAKGLRDDAAVKLRLA